MDKAIKFEDMYEVVVGQLTTALRGFEQLANLIRAGEIELPNHESDKTVDQAQQRIMDQINKLTDRIITSKHGDRPEPKTWAVGTGSSETPVQEVSETVSAVPPPPFLSPEEAGVPLPFEQPAPKQIVEDPKVKEVAEIEAFNTAERTVYDRLRASGMPHDKIVEAVRSIKTGEVQVSLRQEQARIKAAETLINTEDYLKFFHGIEGLTKRFVHSNLVPGGRGDLSVGQGLMTLPYFSANPEAANPSKLKDWYEGFYRNPENEDDWALLIQLQKETLVFPNINQVEDPIPFLVAKNGPLAGAKQVLSVLPFPLLKDLYFEAEARLKALNGI